MILHVTNGSAAGGGIQAAAIDGQMLTWDDVLHDGPVPSGVSAGELCAIRAAFIAARGWGAHDDVAEQMAARDEVLSKAELFDEVVLWFEHDLYDQLQLLQILDRLADVRGDVRLGLIQTDDYLGAMAPDDLAGRFPLRAVVTAEQLAFAGEAWAAFRHDDPRWLARIAARRVAPLPWVPDALTRLLRQYPSDRDGLSRSERLLLEAIADGARTPATAFLHSQKRDEPYFLGDSTFAWYLAMLGEGPTPLILAANGQPVRAPGGADPVFWHGELTLTGAGRAVLAGEADWAQLHGIDRWFGGVHLDGRRPRWRWDEAEGLVEAA